MSPSLINGTTTQSTLDTQTVYMTDSYKPRQSVLSFVVNLDIYTIIAYILIRDFIHWGLTVALQKFVLNTLWISTGSKNDCLEWHFGPKSFNDWPSLLSCYGICSNVRKNFVKLFKYGITYIIFTADILLVLVEIDLIFSKYGRIDWLRRSGPLNIILISTLTYRYWIASHTLYIVSMTTNTEL